MNLRQFILNHLQTSLQGDVTSPLLDYFDRDRVADTRPADRRIVYGVAFGVHGDWEQSPIQGDAMVWKTVETFFDLLCDVRTPEGDWLWYIPNQNKTFQHRYTFAFFSILMTVRDFGHHLGEARLKRVAEAFHRPLEQNAVALRTFVESGKRNAGLNIITAMAAAVWIGGHVYRHDEWMRTATATIQKVIARQSPDGFWPDDSFHDGPATLYNAVTLAHMAEYALASNDPAAGASIEKAATFHEYNTYCDGSPVETIDERNRYHHDPLPAMFLAFAPFEKSRAFAARYCGALGEHGLSGLSPQGMDLYGVNPDALWIEALKRIPQNVEIQPWPKAFTFSFDKLPFRTVRRAPWQFVVAGVLRRGPSRRYHNDLQNHLSIFHDKLGLIVGGGNSLHDAYFSTFHFGGQYLADEATVTGTGDTAKLQMRFGAIRATMEVKLAGDAIEITASAKSDQPLPANSTFALHLPGRLNDMLRINGNDMQLSTTAAWLDHIENGALVAGPVKLECDKPLHIDWPCFPVDIYDPPKRSLDEPVLRVAVALTAEPVMIRLTVQGNETVT